MSVCLLIGLMLAACGALIAIFTSKKSKKNKRSAPPPLPPRVNVGTGSSAINRHTSNNNSNNMPLPPRRTSVPAIAGAKTGVQVVVFGPRGIRPEQFPACPIDKQRNKIGAPQKIFWNDAENCYRCTHGHRFQSNGTIICN